MQQRSTGSDPEQQQGGTTSGSPQSSTGTGGQPAMNPGDEAPPGTPGTAEDLCPECSGSGKLANGSPCTECGGSGRVMRGIGGG